jgi:hypothetical protein
VNRMGEDPVAFVPVTLRDGSWKTPAGESVPWYQVRTDLLAAEEVEAAMERVLSVYGVSDVVVDAFSQLRKELPRPPAAPTSAE